MWNCFRRKSCITATSGILPIYILIDIWSYQQQILLILIVITDRWIDLMLVGLGERVGACMCVAALIRMFVSYVTFIVAGGEVSKCRHPRFTTSTYFQLNNPWCFVESPQGMHQEYPSNSALVKSIRHWHIDETPQNLFLFKKIIL